MNIKPVWTLTLALALLAGASLQAQTEGTPPPPPPPAYPYTGSVITDTSPLVADVSLPYAFNFNNVGVVGDLGGMWRNSFFGAEISYYDAQPDHHNWYGGGYYGGYNENITTLNFAYRCYFPIPTLGYDPYGRNMGFYIGGAAGAGWADVHTGYFFYPGYGPNYYNSGTAQFDANGVAGFQFNFNHFVGLKIGYRYVWVDNSHLFYPNQRLSSSALEAGLAFHF